MALSEKEWKEKYFNRLVERGVDKKTAREMTEIALDEEDVMQYDPEDVADDELSYWD